MTLQGPLSVHLSGRGVEKHVDAYDLEFTVDAKGGYQTATFSTAQAIASTDGAFGPDARVMVDDGRTGRRVFEGYLDATGRTASLEAGQIAKVGVVGAASVLTDRLLPYVAVDSELDGWAIVKSTSPGATAEGTTLPTDDSVPALVMQFPAGQPVDSTSFINMRYQRFLRSGQMLGGYSYTRVAGQTSVGFVIAATVLTPAGVKSTLRSATFSTSSSTPTPDQVGTDWTGDRDRLTVLINRVGVATNISADTVWGAVYNLWVRAQLHDLTGSPITTAGVHNHGYVFAHEVVTDALTVFTNLVDVPGASIDTTFTQQIPQLAYPDPVRFPDILNDLALVEPDMIWEVLESNPAGKHRFNLRRWPTDVRYEADTVDGYDSPGAEQSLATSVAVSYTDANGDPQTFTTTFAVPALDQWSRRRDADAVDLGAEVGSLSNATAVAAAIQATMTTVPYAATLTVARPIRDLYLGRDVMPWEIRPGYLLDVRDADTPPMQVTEMTYNDNEQTATLTLGTPVFSVDSVVARLARRRTRSGGKPAS